MKSLTVVIVFLVGAALSSCASTQPPEDRAARMEQYKACSAEHPPEMVAEKCGKYLN